MVIPAGTQTAELISVALLQSPRRQPSTPGSPWAESQPAAGIWGDRGTPLGCSMHWDSFVASLQSDHSQNSGDCAFGNQQSMRASSPGTCAPGLPVSRAPSPALLGGIWLKVSFLDHLLHPTAPRNNKWPALLVSAGPTHHAPFPFPRNATGLFDELGFILQNSTGSFS